MSDSAAHVHIMLRWAICCTVDDGANAQQHPETAYGANCEADLHPPSFDDQLAGSATAPVSLSVMSGHGIKMSDVSAPTVWLRLRSALRRMPGREIQPAGWNAHCRGTAWAESIARVCPIDKPWPHSEKMRAIARRKVNDLTDDERLGALLADEVSRGAERWWNKALERTG